MASATEGGPWSGGRCPAGDGALPRTGVPSERGFNKIDRASTTSGCEPAPVMSRALRRPIASDGGRADSITPEIMDLTWVDFSPGNRSAIWSVHCLCKLAHSLYGASEA